MLFFYDISGHLCTPNINFWFWGWKILGTYKAIIFTNNLKSDLWNIILISYISTEIDKSLSLHIPNISGDYYYRIRLLILFNLINKKEPIIINNQQEPISFQENFWNAFFLISEYLCYFNSVLSITIAYKVFKMENLTFVNRCMILYYFLDSVTCVIETYFLFKLKNERYFYFEKVESFYYWTTLNTRQIDF